MRNVKASREGIRSFAELGFPSRKERGLEIYECCTDRKRGIGRPSQPLLDFSPAAGEKSEQILAAFNFDRNGFAALNLAFADIQVIRDREGHEC